MPVHKIPGGYQYGQSGKKYYGKDAKKKALKQQLAIELSGYEETKLPRSKRTTRRKTIRHTSNEIPLTRLTQDLVELGRQTVNRLFGKDE